MGQWRSLAKEVIDRGLILAKFFCFIHVTSTYLCSSSLVRTLTLPSQQSHLRWLYKNQRFVFWCLQVHGPSMLPTLNMTGDVVIAEHVSHRLGKLGRGDLVLVRSPENPRKIVTKRIVGMEGDKITFFLDPNFGERCRTAVVRHWFLVFYYQFLLFSHNHKFGCPLCYIDCFNFCV